MAGAQFAAQIRDFKNVVESRLDAFEVETIREIGARLVARSPVKTGLFRSNWFYSFNAPDTASTTSDTGGVVVNNIGAIPPKSFGGVHYLQNNLPYAWRLETGYSKQAPAGIVGITALEFGGIVDDVVLRVRQ